MAEYKSKYEKPYGLADFGREMWQMIKHPFASIQDDRTPQDITNAHIDAQATGARKLTKKEIKAKERAAHIRRHRQGLRREAKRQGVPLDDDQGFLREHESEQP